MSRRQEQSVDNAPSNAIAMQVAPWSDISFQCYDNDIPAFVGPMLEKLYGNLFSSLAYYRVFGGADNARAFVVREGRDITSVWLFRRHGHTVRVINEGIRVDEADMMRFARYIFDRYASVNVISFHAVRPSMSVLPLPCQRFNCLEDMVLNLPASAESYHASLGRSTRSYVHRYLNKLKRDFPAFSFLALDASNLDEASIRHIIELNHLRMASKGKESINDEDTTRRIVAMALECGLVGVIMIDGRICAGSINYRVGNNYFLETLAHDPAYDEYRLGTLCCYLTICECIARKGGEYHFLWGQDEYKTRLLGVQRDLDDLVIYRSYLHMVLYGKLVVQHELHAVERRIRLWVRGMRRRDSVGGRVVNRLWRLMRGRGMAKP